MNAPAQHGDPSTDTNEPAVRVLLVEDNIGFAYGIRDALVRQSREPFEVEEAHTLAEALTALSAQPANVILLDLGLPDSARFETFDRMKAAAPHTPIIILTVLDDDDVAMKAMRSGAQDYLVKDEVNKTLLVRAIKYSVERSRIEKALHDLSGRLLRLQDEERRHIARALHDMTAQKLTALSMNLSALKRWAGECPPEAEALLDEARDQATQCSADMRTMSYLLHPPLLDELGLAGALRDYADGFAERSGIRVDLDIPKDFSRLPKNIELTLFRVMQESLSNIHQHSGSPTASISLTRSESNVVLEVRDRGRGIHDKENAGAASTEGVGVAGMRERVRQVGGGLTIESAPTGTWVRASLPLEPKRA